MFFNPKSLVSLFMSFVWLTILAFPLQAADNAKSQIYELRVYVTKSVQQQEAVVAHWQRDAIAAYNRIGVRSIGVFTERQDSATNSIYVLLPFESADAFANAPAKLLADEMFQKAADRFLNLSKTNAAYERIESSLSIAFAGMKSMSVPPATGERTNWVFELRTYMSASENRGWNKIKMFNDGEIAVMKEVGLAPVFFGQNLTGSQLPSLTYITCGENMEQHQKHWNAFSAAPGWNKLKNDPQYHDNMTGMTRVLLKRTSASQL